MGMDRGGVTGRWVVKLGVATAVIHRADPPTRDKPEAARRTRTIDDNSRAAGRCYSKRRECAQRSVAAVVAAAASEVCEPVPNVVERKFPTATSGRLC